MSIRSGGRKVSFDLLASDSSGDDGGLSLRPASDPFGGEYGRSTRRKRKSKASKKRKLAERAAVAGDPGFLAGLDHQTRPLAENGHCEDGMGFGVSENRSVVESVCENTVVVPAPEPESSQGSCVSYVELRQRNVNGSVGDEPRDEETSTRVSSAGPWRPESKGNIGTLAKEGSLDWNRVMAEDPNLLGAYCCRLLCLFGFISVIANYYASTNCYDHLEGAAHQEVSEAKCCRVSRFWLFHCVGYRSHSTTNDRYQFNISYHTWTRNSQTLCGIQCLGDI